MKKPIQLLMSTVLFALLSSAQAAEFLGVSWSGSVYRIDASDASSMIIGRTGYGVLQSLATDPAGVHYAATDDDELISVDPRTGYSTLVCEAPNLLSARGLEWQSPGYFYVMDSGGWQNNCRLKILETATGDVTLIGETNHEYAEALVMSPGDTLFSWDIHYGLLRVDATTGATTDVDGIEDGEFIKGLAFDPSGQMYGFGGDETYLINRDTGAATLVGESNYGSDVQGVEYHDFTPNECLLLEVENLVGGQTATFTVTGAPEGETIGIVYSLRGGETVVQGQMNYCATLGLGNLKRKSVLGQGPVVGGEYVLEVWVPGRADGLLLYFQAAQKGTCPTECVSNILARVGGH